MTRLVPVLFVRQGTLVCRVLTAPTEKILEALRLDVVFTLDTAMRIAHGVGCFSGGDLHAYTTSADLPERLAAAGLISSTPCPDTTLVRPWPGPPRLLLAVVEELPPSRAIRGAFRAVEADRLRRELLGAVGPRADLFALLEHLERRE
jgi:pimeloyl-ACP methyl ester carboxylesterase